MDERWGSGSSISSSAFGDEEEEDDEKEVEMKYVPPEDLEEVGVEGMLKTVPGECEIRLKTEEDQELTSNEEEMENVGVGKRVARKVKGKVKKRTRTTRKKRDEDPDEWKPAGVRRSRGRPKVERVTTPGVGGRPKRRKSEKVVACSGDESETFGDLVRKKKPAAVNRNRRTGGTAGESDEIRKARKRVANMTPEQIEKERQRKRDYRRRLRMIREELKREASGGEPGQVNEDEVNGRPEHAAKARWQARKEKEREVRDQRKNSQTTNKSCEGYRKKTVAEMSEEEKERIRQVWREQALRKKEKRSMKAKTKRRKGVVMDIEERRKRDRERMQRKRATWTAEQRKEVSRQAVIARQMKRAAMTEEEREEERHKNYFKQQAKLAMMSAEERQAKKEREKQLRLLRPSGTQYSKLLEKYGPEGLRERRVNAWREMSPLKKQEHLDKMREHYRKRMEKIKGDPEEYAKMQQSWRDRYADYMRRKKEGLVKTRARCAHGTLKRQRVGYNKNWNRKQVETESQKKLRRVLDKQRRLRRKLEQFKKLMDSGMSMEQIHQQIEANPRRQDLCIRQRLFKAKCQLRASLQAAGATTEEITQRSEELRETYKPNSEIRPYKPRPENRKPLGPEDILKLENEIEALEKVAQQLAEEQEVPVPVAPACQLVGSDLIRTAKEELPVDRRRGRPPAKNLPSVPVPSQFQPSTSNSVITPQAPVTSGQSYQQQPVFPVQTPSISYPQQQQYTYPHAPTPYTVPTYPYSHVQLQPHPNLDQPQSHFTSVQPLVNSAHFQDPSTHLNYQNSSHEPSVASSQNEDQYANSSYFDNDTLPSPGINYDDNYSQSSYQNQTEPQYRHHQPHPEQPKPEMLTSSNLANPQSNSNSDNLTPPPRRRRGRPPKGSQPISQPKKPKREKGRLKNANARLWAKKVDEFRNAICDLCGGAYNQENLKQHQRQMHNPNYDRANRKCKLCQKTFNYGQHWYVHYLNEHVRPNQPPKKKVCVCEHCGKGFVNQANYNTHLYYQHGEGAKPENFVKCELCPAEKRFKTKLAHYAHLKRSHPNYQRPGHDCYRCEESLSNDKMLREHVAIKHPESYFPCGYCNVCKFSQMGLHFHYERCPKIDKAEKKRMEKAWLGVFTVERLPLKCEFCGLGMVLGSLSTHYRKMHNVEEDRFECELCKKGFNSRVFWANHLEERHEKTLEELGEFVYKLNARNREGLRVEPKYRRKEDRRLVLKLQKQGHRVDEEMLLRRRDRKKVTRRRGRLKKKRRRIQVICEEEEVEEPEIKVEVESEASQTEEEDDSECSE